RAAPSREAQAHCWTEIRFRRHRVDLACRRNRGCLGGRKLRQRVWQHGRVQHEQGRGGPFGRHESNGHHRRYAIPCITGEELVPDRCHRIEDDAMGKLGIASGRACAVAPRSNVVTWTDDDRRELRELCRVHDQMMAEQRANDPGEEVVMEGARPPVPEPEPGPFTEYQSDVVAHVTVELHKRWREERDEAIAPLKAEIAELKGKLDTVAELKGKVDALLTLLQGAKAEVIGLPRRRPSNAA